MCVFVFKMIFSGTFGTYDAHDTAFYLFIYCTKGVLEDIEDEFNLTDEWMGGLLQTAFIICYFASAPLFGFLGDRYSRKWLIIFGIFVWSCCTMTSSFMPVNFV